MTLTVRSATVAGASTKGSALTHAEMDANWDHVANVTASVTGAVARTVRSKLGDVVSVKDFGAVGDGVTDDTVAIQAALNLAVAGTDTKNNPAIYLPNGTYVVSATLAPVNSASNFRIYGDGQCATTVKWNGSAGIPFFKFINARAIWITDLAIYGKSTAKPSALVQYHRAAGGIIGSAVAYCGLQRVRLGDGTGDHTKSVLTSADVGQDSNNEGHVFEDVDCIAPATYGYHFSHSNSLLHKIVRGTVQSYGTAAFCNDSSGANNASFVADSVALAGLAGSAILLLGLPRFPITMKDCWHENSGTDNTAVLKMVSAWTGGGELNFIGGNYNMGDITVGGTYTVDFEAGDAFSNVNFYGVPILAPAVAPWRLRGNGSVVNFFGGAVSFSSLDYSAEVNLLYTKQGAGTPTYTNLGGGILNVRHRSKGSASKDVTPVVSVLTGAGTDTIDASGMTGETMLVNLAAPDTLTTITNGFIGQRITLIVGNENLTITHDGSFTSDKIYLRGRMNKTLRRLDTITLERGDAPSFGSEWLEVGCNERAVQLSGSNVNVTQVGNVGGGTDDLITYSLPANALDQDSSQGARGARITAWGTTANNANAKTVALLFGGTSLVSLALTAGQLSPWRIAAEAMWTAEDAQKFIAAITQGGTAKQSDTAIGTTAADDDAAITIKCTGAGTADNDIVQHGLIVELIR